MTLNLWRFNPDRVFVLADLEIFGPLGQVLMEDIETLGSGGALGHVDYMRCVVQHAIQAALGAQQCSGQKLADALKVSGRARKSLWRYHTAWLLTSCFVVCLHFTTFSLFS